MLARAGSWVGSTIGGLTLGRFWLYQDFAAGSGPNITITDNENGTGLSFDAARIVDNSAVVTKTNGNPIFTNTAELPSQLVSVTSNTGASVVLDSTPAVGEGTVRIWYLYSMSTEEAPSDIELAPHFVTSSRTQFLDARFLDAALNLSDLTNASTARTNLGFTAQTAGQVLFGDGGTTFTSEANLFWDSSNDRLGIGINTPSYQLHARKTTASAVGAVETQFTGSPSLVILQAARSAGADLANADVVGRIEAMGMASSAYADLAFIDVVYTGNGTTQRGDIVFSVAQAGAPTEILRLKNDGTIDTTLGAGAVQSDASGILSSGTLGVTSGGTGTSTQFTQGSVVFAGASGVYSQDNANLFFDGTGGNLGVGTNSLASNYRLTVKTEDDNFGSGIALEGTGSGSNRYWELFPTAAGFLYFRNPGASITPLVFDNGGRIGMQGATPTAAFNVKNEGTLTGDVSMIVQAIAAQTGNLLQLRASDGTTVLSFFDVLGSLTLPTATIKTSLVIEDPGAGSNTVTLQSGVVSSSYSLTLPTAQATAADQVLTNDGSGVLSWSQRRTYKAGSVSLSTNDLSKAVTFVTTFGSANYTPLISFKNTADGDPVYIPYTIIAHAATGFTVEWNDAIPTNNYTMLWAIVEHYDP